MEELAQAGLAGTAGATDYFRGYAVASLAPGAGIVLGA